MKKIIDFIKKYWYWILIAIIFIFVIPYIINQAYLLGDNHSIFKTKWQAHDVLSFYGSMLAFLGTVFLGAVALKQNEKANEINDKMLNSEIMKNAPILNIDYDNISYNDTAIDHINLYYPREDIIEDSVEFNEIVLEQNSDPQKILILNLKSDKYNPVKYIYKINIKNLSENNVYSLSLKELKHTGIKKQYEHSNSTILIDERNILHTNTDFYIVIFSNKLLINKINHQDDYKIYATFEVQTTNGYMFEQTVIINFSNFKIKGIHLPPIRHYDTKERYTDKFNIYEIRNSILYNCFINKKSINILNEIRKINSEAFANKEYIEEIILNNSVEEIGRYAFTDCKKLKSINIPDNCIFESSIFKGCNDLENIKINNNKDYTFKKKVLYSENKIIKYLPIKTNKIYKTPNNIKEIDHFAFYGCKNLKEINISENVAMIGIFAFYNCENLIRVNFINNNVCNIYENAFHGCKNLREINLPNRIKRIANFAFYECENLTKIDIHNVINIGENAFYGCKSLKKIDIPNVTNIGNDAFGSCINLKEIKISEGIKTIGYGTFANCTGLTNLDFLPKSITEIEEYAFLHCTGFETIKIPDNIEKLGVMVFKQCYNLKAIELSNNITEIPNGLFIECKNLKEIIIPEKVNKINRYAFHQCKKLEEVTLSKDLKIIEESAFDECESLKKIIIPNGVTTIDDMAFANCRNLKEITIPNSVNEIGNMTFFGNEDLTIITQEDSKAYKKYKDIYKIKPINEQSQSKGKRK